MLRKTVMSSMLCLAYLGSAPLATAAKDGADATATKASYATTEAAPGAGAGQASGEDTTLVFSAPPRESAEEGARLYGPIAAYLSSALNRPVVYRHPGNWLSYQTDMTKGVYDLVFDGPHFNSWRITHLNHNTLARLGEEHAFAVIVRKDAGQITDVKQLAGKRVCAMNPPNLGTLVFQEQFDNPARQPLIVNTVGWEKIYLGVVSENRCVAGVLPVANLNRYDRPGNFSRVVYRSRPLPNQAFSASPRVKSEDQARITAALTSPDASQATAALRAAYGSEVGLVRATKGEYAGLDNVLKNVWAYTR